MESNQKILLVIGGPTASGKTGVAITLAQHFATEIISADSRQFYREMSIGTAKPSKEELSTVPHHFIDCISIEETFNAGDFERQALALLNHLFEDKDLVILAGGSGLFIRALCEGLDEFPVVSPGLREKLNLQLENQGIESLQRLLAEFDPEYYEIVDRSNPQRLIRALEICLSSGRTYSSFRKGSKIQRSFKPVYIQLDWDRKQLYERINKRVDLMLEAGLEAEARALYPQKELNALQTVGYQEFFDYFDGKISRAEAIELIKRNSRRYAKRQLTWLRKDDFWKLFKPEEIDQMIAYVELQMSYP